MSIDKNHRQLWRIILKIGIDVQQGSFAGTTCYAPGISLFAIATHAEMFERLYQAIRTYQEWQFD